MDIKVEENIGTPTKKSRFHEKKKEKGKIYCQYYLYIGATWNMIECTNVGFKSYLKKLFDSY